MLNVIERQESTLVESRDVFQIKMLSCRHCLIFVYIVLKNVCLCHSAGKNRGNWPANCHSNVWQPDWFHRSISCCKFQTTTYGEPLRWLPPITMFVCLCWINLEKIDNISSVIYQILNWSIYKTADLNPNICFHSQEFKWQEEACTVSRSLQMYWYI